MALSNYTDLVAEVNDYLDQADLTGKPDTFIKLFEVRASREIVDRRMDKRSTGTFTVAGTVSIPSDWVEMRDWYTDGDLKKSMVYRPSHEVEDLVANTFNGQPAIWTIRNGVFEVFPKPDSATAYGYTMDYRAAIPALTSSAPTNWLMTSAPDVYLWGTLMEAAVYADDAEGATKYLSLYERARNSVNALEQRWKSRPTGRMRSTHSSGSVRYWAST